MMKRNLIIAIFSTAFLFSCSNVDFGTTNENENGTQAVDMGALLTGAILDFSTNSGQYLLQPTLYAQYQSEVIYTTESRYSESPKDWSEYYTKDINNLNTIIKFLSDPANITPYVLSQGSINNQTGVAKIFRAVVIKRVTDTYGDVPFSEAGFGLDNPTPKYDTQEEIYKAFIADLQEGRDMLSASDKGPTGDILYKGDISKWKKFANSMLMASALQLSKRYPGNGEYAATVFNEALNNGSSIETFADEAWFRYDRSNGFLNPYSITRVDDYRLSQEFTDALKGRSDSYNRTSNHVVDARLRIFASSATLNGLPYGYTQQSLDNELISTSTNVRSQLNGRYNSEDSSLPLFVAAYSLLNRAEAAALGWTSEDPTTLLSDAITVSYASLNAKYGTPAVPILINGTSYRNARLNDASASSEMLLQVIREEKWVALFPSGFEAWTEWRRTGVPALQPAVDYLNNGTIPGRYNYPTTEINLNRTNYNIGVSNLSPATDNNSSEVWWAQ